jgi:flagellar hook-basal body complex protein FliE
MKIDFATIARTSEIRGIELERTTGPTEAGPAEGASFGDVLAGMIGDVASTKAEATQQAEALARGASDDLHGTMIAVKEAEISMKLVGSIRNKLLDAFQELWRTNV